MQLDVWDPGGHLDFTRRARAGALSNRVKEATLGVTAVGALPFGFQFKLGLARVSICRLVYMLLRHLMFLLLPLSPSGLLIVRSVWSCKMRLASTPVILSLLDGPVGVDPAFHVIWARFRMMRWYLACCPEEEPRIYRMLDLISASHLCC